MPHRTANPISVTQCMLSKLFVTKGVPGRGRKQRWAFNVWLVEILCLVVLFFPSRKKLQKPVDTERTFRVQLPIDMSPGRDLTCCVAFGKPCDISVLFPCLG